MQVQALTITAKRFHTVAQGRGAAAHPGFTMNRTPYSEGVKQRPRDWVYNAFSVNHWFLIGTQGAPLDKLGTTLGYGVKPLRGYYYSPIARGPG
jgi:hypothetical protein